MSVWDSRRAHSLISPDLHMVNVDVVTYGTFLDNLYFKKTTKASIRYLAIKGSKSLFNLVFFSFFKINRKKKYGFLRINKYLYRLLNV